MKHSELALMPEEPSRSVLRAEIQVAVLKAKKSPLVEYMQKKTNKRSGLKAVREKLAKIKKPLSEDIVESRAERF